MSTPHNSAKKGEIAKVVLMPGDPLRAKFLAERYLHDPVCFNSVRGMYGYTGTYEGERVSVMGSGMGVPSIGIYSWELYNIYDVDAIIRIGSAGGLAPEIDLRDIVFGQAACTNSNYPKSFGLPGTIAPIADFELLCKGVEAARRLGTRYHVGNLLTSDVFYAEAGDDAIWASMGVLAVEMEAAGLYLNAAKANKRALTIATISDHPLKGESLPSGDRETSFTQMMEVALDTAVTHLKTLR